MSHKDLLVNPITREPSFRTEMVISSYENSFKQIQSKKYIKYNFDRFNIIISLTIHRIFNINDKNDNFSMGYHLSSIDLLKK